MESTVEASTHKTALSASSTKANNTTPTSQAQGHPSNSATQRGTSTARFTVRTAKTFESEKRMRLRNDQLQSHRGIDRSDPLNGGNKETVKEVQGVSAKQVTSKESNGDAGDAEVKPKTQTQVKFTENSNVPITSAEGRASEGQPGREEMYKDQTTKARGRTQWRSMNQTGRSVSLGWRQAGGELNHSSDIAGVPRRAESLERKVTANRMEANKVAAPFSSVLSKVQECSTAAQTDQKSTGPVSSDSPTVRPDRVALALERAKNGKSLPSRLKTRVGRGSIGKDNGPWDQGDLQDQTKHKLQPWAKEQGSFGSTANEITGNQTILERIEKLYGSNTSEVNCEKNTKDSIRKKDRSASFENQSSMNTKGVDTSSNCKKSTTEITSNPPCPSVEWRRVVLGAEKGGTFPRSFSKGARTSSVQESQSTFQTSSDRKDAWNSVSSAVSPGQVWSKEESLERPELGQSLFTRQSKAGDSKRFEGAWDLKTRSLDRARSRVAATKNSFLTTSLTPATEKSCKDFQQSSRSETIREEKDTSNARTMSIGGLESVVDSAKVPGANLTANLKLGNEMDNNTTQNLKHEEKQKDSKVNTSSEQSRSLSAERYNRTWEWARDAQSLNAGVKGSNTNVSKYSNKAHGVQTLDKDRSTLPNPCDDQKDDEDVFELGSSKTQMKRQKNSLEKLQSPSLDSVRNTIHKFEALAKKNQSASQFLHSKRVFSSPEMRTVKGVKKSDSDDAVDGVKGVFNAGSLRKGLLSKSGIRVEHESSPKKNWTIRSFSVVDGGPRFEGHDTQTSTQPVPTTNNKVNDDLQSMTQEGQNMDELDFSKAVSMYVKQIGEEKAKNPLSGKPGTAFLRQLNYNNNCNGGINIDRSDSASMQDGWNSEPDSVFSEDEDKTPTNSPEQISFEIIPQQHSLSKTSTPCKDPQVSQNTATELHSAYPELCMDNEINHPPPPIQSQYSGKKGEDIPFVVTWWNSLEKEDDDDDDDGTERGDDSNYDSDSGESSVTITSCMSQSDRRSFSVSLADLYSFGGVDFESADDSVWDDDEDDSRHRRTASLSSDASAFSCVTLLAPDELDRLLDDVKGLGDNTLQDCEEVKVVVLHKEENTGLGFTIAGGADQNKPVTVHKVIPSGVAAKEGSICEGDRVLSINGTKLQDSAHWEALQTLKKAKGRSMAVVVLRRGVNSKSLHGRNDLTQSQATTDTSSTGMKIHLTLNKCNTDLGFSLEGGVGSRLGDKPITVKKIFQGGPVGLVFPGDRLLEVQGRSLRSFRALEAWNLIKSLPSGPVEVTLLRPSQSH